MLAKLHRWCSLAICLFLPLFVGCFPESGPRPLEGPLSYVDANLVFTKMRRDHGPRYTSELEWNGKPFVANWELGKLIERKQQLQIKPSTDDFSVTELCMALEVALNDYDHCPWHPVINDAILSGFRRSLHAQGSVMVGSPDAPPYSMTVWVKNNGSTWFCQVKGFNAPDPEKTPGFPN